MTCCFSVFLLDLFRESILTFQLGFWGTKCAATPTAGTAFKLLQLNGVSERITPPHRLKIYLSSRGLAAEEDERKPPFFFLGRQIL